MTTIEIVATADAHIEGFRRCVDTVARERRYLALVEGPPTDAARAFVQGLRAAGGVHMVALDRALPGPEDAQVVGWCDIVRDMRPGFGHGGRLGMGLLPAYRGRRLGRRLATAALDAAEVKGIERVELEVFSSNTRAIALYERLGFVREGVRRRARRLDGREEDDVLMARFIARA